MSLKDSISNFFGLNDSMPDEELDYGQPKPAATKPSLVKQNKIEKTEPVSVQSTVPKKETTEKTSKKRVKIPKPSSIDLNQTNVAYDEEPMTTHAPQKETKKVVKMHDQPSQNRASKTQTVDHSRIVILEPRAYSEAMTIAKTIIAGKPVLVNFHLIEEYQARRIVDFLTGTVYAEDGDIKRVADEIFLCTPKGIEIDGTAQTLASSHLFEQ